MREGNWKVFTRKEACRGKESFVVRAIRYVLEEKHNRSQIEGERVLESFVVDDG